MGKILYFWTVLSITGLWSVELYSDESARDGSTRTTSFRRDVAPILLNHCIACHGPKNAEGGYRVDTFALASTAGDSGLTGFTPRQLEESEVYRRVVAKDVDERMPLDGDQLPEPELRVLRRWIEEGAVFDGVDSKVPLASLIPAPRHPDPPATYPRPVPVTALTFSGAGDELYVAGYHEVTVWRPSDGQLLRRIQNIDERTLAIDISPDGKTLAVASGTPGRRGELRLFDRVTGTLRTVLATSADVVMDTAFSPDGQKIAAATADNRLLVLDATTGATELVLASHSDWVTAVAWSSDGTKIASASRDKTVKVYAADSGELLASYAGHGNQIQTVLFHPAGDEIFSAGADHEIHRWTITDAKKSSEVGIGSHVFGIALGGGKLYAVAADGVLRQIDIESAATPKVLYKLSGHRDWIFAIAHHDETNRLASGAYDGEIRIWNTEDGSLVHAFPAAPHVLSKELR